MNDPVIERIAREDPAVGCRSDTANELLGSIPAGRDRRTPVHRRLVSACAVGSGWSRRRPQPSSRRSRSRRGGLGCWDMSRAFPVRPRTPRSRSESFSSDWCASHPGRRQWSPMGDRCGLPGLIRLNGSIR